MILKDPKTLIGLFLFLRKHEQDLDDAVSRFYHSLQTKVFGMLSIEELENLQELYDRDLLKFD